jgi:glycosyltransferase involved in cell wall biosynthesis
MDKAIRRVLMTGDTVGGVWTFTLELARALGARGVEVVLATMGGLPSESQAAEAAEIPTLCLQASEFRLEWMRDPWSDVAESGRWLMRIADEYAPDTVHLNTFGHGGLAFRQPVLLTAHSCVLSWWEAVKREPAPAEWDRYAATVKHALITADRVTAPSQAMASALKRHYGFSECEVVYNGRCAAKFRAGFKEPFVFTAGRLWDEAKNAAALEEISPSLTWPVHMAGEGTDLGKLGRDEMADWYSRAAIYALPARYEPFGLSALEAALSGCALVLGDIPSLREIWGDAAVFVRPDDTGALREALQALIADTDGRIGLARRGLERALSYSPERMAESYLKLYKHELSRCAS